MAGHDPTLALLIGGRSGSGKSSVAYEIHEQLSSAGVMHACIEGDNLDLAYPPPWERGLAEQNLAAMWRNYRAGIPQAHLHQHGQRAAHRGAGGGAGQ